VKGESAEEAQVASDIELAEEAQLANDLESAADVELAGDLELAGDAELADDDAGLDDAGLADDETWKRGMKPRVVARNESRRQLTDPVVMRALAHPIRVALLEALLREGPLTATAASVILDDSPGNMSWHLNVLAKYGFVEEAEGGRGRSRPWRLVNLGTQFEDDPGNPELSVAGEAFSRVLHERHFQRLQQFLNERRSYPPEWRAAAFSSSTVTYLTAEEMKKFGEEITDLLSEYRERSYDVEKRPEGSRAVGIVAFGHPLRPTPSGN
jgi:DNA-binding transcriptional ArsR family regulator